MTYTVREFAFYPAPEQASVGLLFVEDDAGQHWTLALPPANLQTLLSVSDTAPGGFIVPDGAQGFIEDAERLAAPGWPDEWPNPRKSARDLERIARRWQ
jgi:hypothetical protein